MDICFRLGVQHVTVYAFSIENFNRSQEEIDTLFGLLRDRLKHISEYDNSYARYNKIRVRIVGNRSYIPEDILRDLELIEKRTDVENLYRTLNVCFPYTSRDEITIAIKKIALEVAESADPKEITAQTIESNMYLSSNYTAPLDLLIRTSGHKRLSDFMLWQCNSNCTIEFVSTLWPDFGFWSITRILIKWSYFRTMQIMDEQNLKVKVVSTKANRTSILKSLPPAPPLASVSNR